MSNSIEERLYEFLSNYNLIQADINKDEAAELIRGTLSHLGENEEVMTFFIASAPVGDEQGRHAFAVTNTNRIVINPEDTPEAKIIDIDRIVSIDNGIALEESILRIATEDEEIPVQALSKQGVLDINDALYSAIHELAPSERLVEIFGATPEEPAEEVVEETIETTPEEEPTTEEPVETPEPTELEAEKTEDKTEEKTEEDKTESVTAASAEPIKSDQILDSSFDADTYGGSDTAVHKKKAQNKPLLYILIAVGVVIVGFVGINILNYFMRTMTAQSEANHFVDLFNQVDEVYSTAVEYSNAGAGKATPEQWDELDKKARDLETQIADSSSNDITKNLADAVYYYDEAMITAINHGKNYASSKNSFDKSSLDRNLNQANLNRSTVLGFIDANYPDLLDKVKNTDDTEDAEAAKVEQRIKDAESQPADENTDQQNSQGS